MGGTPAAKLALVPPEQHSWGAPGGPQLQAQKWVYTQALIWGVGIYRVYTDTLMHAYGGQNNVKLALKGLANRHTGIYYTGYIPGPYAAQPY